MLHLSFGCPEIGFPPWTLPSNAAGSTCGGIQAEILRALAAQERWNLTFVLLPFDQWLDGQSNLSFQGALEASLYAASVDLAAGLPEVATPLTPTACEGTCDGLLASYPALTSFQRVLVRKQRDADDFTRLFAPFDASVWLASFLTVLVLAAALVALSALSPRHASPLKLRSFTDALYDALFATLGGDDSSTPWPSGPARIIRLAAASFALVITATYTANLAAFFTAPSYTLHGPASADALSRATVCVPLDFTVPLVAPHVSRAFSAPRQVVAAGGLSAALTHCHEAVLSGAAEAVVSYDATLQDYTLASGACRFDEAIAGQPLDVVPGLAFSPVTLHYFMKSAAGDLLKTFNVALLKLLRSKEYLKLLEEFYLNGVQCGSGFETGSGKVTFSQIVGLFVLVGCLIVLSLFLALRDRYAWSRHLPTTLEAPCALRDRQERKETDKLDELLLKVDRLLAMPRPADASAAREDSPRRLKPQLQTRISFARPTRQQSQHSSEWTPGSPATIAEAQPGSIAQEGDEAEGKDEDVILCL